MHLVTAAKLLMDVTRRGYHARMGAGLSMVDATLPTASVAPATPTSSPPDTSGLPRSAALRVLLVDDCPNNRLRACDLLLRWGIEPAIACDGAEAVQLASEQDFDIILMDVMMPVMDGLEATEHIRQFEREHPLRPRVPVVAYSSCEVTSDEALIRRVGMNAVLKKPCDAIAMGECLQRWCAGKSASTRSQMSSG